MVVVRRSTDSSSLRLQDIDSLDIVALGSDIRADPPEYIVPDVLLIDVIGALVGVAILVVLAILV